MSAGTEQRKLAAIMSTDIWHCEMPLPAQDAPLHERVGLN
jgi:hypothetical protein